MKQPNNNTNNARRNPINSITSQGQQFRNHYYELFSKDGLKCLRKELIIKYHGLICAKNPSIRCVNRHEVRSINRYFNSFASQENLIINSLQELIADGAVNYKRDYELLKNRRT